MSAVPLFVLSAVLIVTGVAFCLAGSTIEGSIFICAGALGCILIVMTYFVVSAIRENKKKEESP